VVFLNVRGSCLSSELMKLMFYDILRSYVDHKSSNLGFSNIPREYLQTDCVTNKVCLPLFLSLIYPRTQPDLHVVITES